MSEGVGGAKYRTERNIIRRVGRVKVWNIFRASGWGGLEDTRFGVWLLVLGGELNKEVDGVLVWGLNAGWEGRRCFFVLEFMFVMGEMLTRVSGNRFLIG